MLGISRRLWSHGWLAVLLFFGLASSASAYQGATGHYAVYTAKRKHMEYFARGADGYLHFHHWATGKWGVDKRTFRRGGKVGQGEPIAAVYSPASQHAEAFYRGTDGYIRYVGMTKRGWVIKALRVAGKVFGSMSAVYEPQRKMPGLFFRDKQGYLRYLYNHRGTWMVDARSFRRGGKVGGDISAVFSPKRNHSEVYYRGNDGYLRFFYLSKGWKLETKAFRAFGKVEGSLSAVYAKQRKHSEVFFRGRGGYLRYVYVHNGKWMVDARTFRKGGIVNGDVSAVFANQRNHSEVFYRGRDERIRYFFLHRGRWHVDTNTFKRGNISSHGIVAIYNTARRHSEVTYPDRFGTQHHFHLTRKGWKLDLIQNQAPAHNIPRSAQTPEQLERIKREAIRYAIAKQVSQKYGAAKAKGYLKASVLNGQICKTKRNVFRFPYIFKYHVTTCTIWKNNKLVKSWISRVRNATLNNIDAPFAVAWFAVDKFFYDEFQKGPLAHVAQQIRKFDRNVGTFHQQKSKELAKELKKLDKQIKADVKRKTKELEKAIKNGLLAKIKGVISTSKDLGPSQILAYFTGAVIDKLAKEIYKKSLIKAANPVALTKLMQVSQTGLKGTKAGVRASRISAVLGLAAGLAFEFAQPPINILINCAPYSGRAKRCCIENQLSADLLTISFNIVTLIIQAAIDIAIIQPLVAQAAGQIAGGLASVSAGLGGVAYPIAHFALSAAINLLAAGAIMGFKALIFDQVTKPLHPGLRRVVAAIMRKTGLKDNQLHCLAGLCAPDNNATMCKQGNSPWTKEGQAKLNKKKKGKERTIGVCLQTHTGKFLTIKQGRVRLDGRHCRGNAVMLMTGTGVGKLQTGDEISLRSAKTKRYWTIQPGGQLFVTNTKKGEWDNMYIYHESGSGKIGHGSKVGIYSSHFNWLVAEPGKPYAKADRNEKQVWETFRLYFTSKVVPFCLQGVKKQYVATLPSGLAAYANRGSCGPWETHYLEASKPGPIKSGDKVAIRSHHGGYWSAQRTGILQCNREQAKIWETFTIYKTDASGKKKRNGTIKYGDHILLRSYHGKWMTAEFGGNAHLIVNRNTHGGWSAFKFSKP